MEPWPLSPPTLTHISCSGINPECQVSRPSLNNSSVNVAQCHVCSHLLLNSSVLKIFSSRLFTQTHGACWNAWPLLRSGNEKDIISPLIPPVRSVASLRCSLSEAMDTLKDFSQLQDIVMYILCILLEFCFPYVWRILRRYHGRASSDLMARHCVASSVTVTPASPSSFCLSSLESAFTSRRSCVCAPSLSPLKLTLHSLMSSLLRF